MAGRITGLGVFSCRVRTCFLYVIKPLCHFGDLCISKSYPSLECLLCISAMLERVEIS